MTTPFVCTARMVTLVCGPPLAGKSTYVNQHWTEGDIVWDQDCIVRAITGLPLHEKGLGHYIGVVLGMREGFIRSLRAGELKQGRAWFIICGAKRADREYFRGVLQAEVVMLQPPIEVCLERARKQERSRDVIAAIHNWFREYEPSTMTTPFFS